jgi:hypothetical protein
LLAVRRRLRRRRMVLLLTGHTWSPFWAAKAEKGERSTVFGAIGTTFYEIL